MTRITRGIPTDRLDETAALLYDAFEQKLVHGIRPDSAEQGRRIIARSLTPELGWVALAEDGRVLGVAGVAMRGHHFSHMGYRLFAEEFGALGAVSRWVRATAESLIARPRKGQWRVEVLAVAEAARGAGIGTALLEAVIDAARAAGMRSVGLEVVDANERALQLYERIGFRAVGNVPTGALTAGGGYRAVRFMRLDLSQDA